MTAQLHALLYKITVQCSADIVKLKPSHHVQFTPKELMKETFGPHPESTVHQLVWDIKGKVARSSTSFTLLRRGVR